MTPVRRLGRVLRIHVEVLQHDRLAERGLVVQTRTPLAVTTRADLEVEGTVDPVGGDKFESGVTFNSSNLGEKTPTSNNILQEFPA